MPISFQCPQCGKKLRAPDGAVGKASKCPGCGAMVTCPEPIYDAEVVDTSGDPGFNPYADLDVNKPYAMVSPPAGPQSTAQSRRPCPMCGEMILTSAAKCRYCDEVFDPALRKVANKSKSKKFSRGESSLSGGEIAVALLCSGIGCIAGIVWMVQGKPKGLKMFGLSFAMQIFWGIVRAVVELSMRQVGP